MGWALLLIAFGIVVGLFAAFVAFVMWLVVMDRREAGMTITGPGIPPGSKLVPPKPRRSR